MKLVRNVSEITDNMDKIDQYLDNKVEPFYSFALGLIKKGVCFTARKVDGAYRFYPSRFIGYANNSMDQHLNNDMKDGKETNPAITHILGCPVCKDSMLEKEYRLYCEHLGFVANDKGAFGVERKFWKL